MIIMNKCVKCGVSQVDHQQVFLTDDKHCSVCNAKYKDRPRTKPYFEFKTIKIGKNKNYNSFGRKTSRHDRLVEKYGGGTTTANAYRRKILESKKRRMDEYI